MCCLVLSEGHCKKEKKKKSFLLVRLPNKPLLSFMTTGGSVSLHLRLNLKAFPIVIFIILSSLKTNFWTLLALQVLQLLYRPKTIILHLPIGVDVNLNNAIFWIYVFDWKCNFTLFSLLEEISVPNFHAGFLFTTLCGTKKCRTYMLDWNYYTYKRCMHPYTNDWFDPGPLR